MARRTAGGRATSRARRISAVAVAAAAAAFTCGLAGSVAHADDPAPAPDTTVADDTVATGEFDGAEVAVGVPPVPPTTVEVAVGLPPVPPVTIPDAPRVAAEAPVPAASAAAKHRADKHDEVQLQLPETGAAATHATAIVAGAAVSIGAALKALANRG